MGPEVCVVDPDPEFRAAAHACLTRAGLTARVVAEGRVALSDADDACVFVLDVCLPDINGFELCRELRDRHGDSVGILLVSRSKTDASDRTAGILLGADDYLVKPVDMSEFTARVRRAVSRSRATPQERPLAVIDVPMPQLTKRELDVLRLLAEGLNQAGIAARLFVTEKTVSSHIQNILGKLDVHSRAEAVAVAFRTGLVAIDGHPAVTKGVARSA